MTSTPAKGNNVWAKMTRFFESNEYKAVYYTVLAVSVVVLMYMRYKDVQKMREEAKAKKESQTKTA